jgi:hypothetical protein
MADSYIQTGDGSFEADGAAAEAAKVEAARTELIDEAVPAGEGLIMGKYNSTDEVVEAFKSLQSEYSRIKGGQEAAPSVPQETAPVQQEQQEQAGSQVTPDQAMAIRESMFKQVGGEDRYKAVAGWASTNLPEDRLTSFNKALEAGDQSQIINQLKGLQYDHMMATGYEPRLARGSSAAQSSAVPFESEAQVVAAMNDPRYQNGPSMDPAYIKDVEKRMAASTGVFQGR